MGLFTKDKKLKFKLIPSTPEQKAARSYLEDVYQQELKYPAEKIADLSANEQTIQNQLGSYLENLPAGYANSEKYYNDVLSGNYDPMTSPYYQGVRSEAEFNKARAVSGVARSAQKAGMARSTPAMALQEQTGEEYDSRTLQVLGQLFENERNRKEQAAAAIPALKQSQISSLSAAEQQAAVKRQVEQAKLTAAYNAAIQTMLAPYIYNANIASALLSEQRYASYTTGGGMTDFGMIASLGTQALGSYMLAGAIGGLGAGAGAGVGTTSQVTAGRGAASSWLSAPM